MKKLTKTEAKFLSVIERGEPAAIMSRVEARVALRMVATLGYKIVRRSRDWFHRPYCIAPVNFPTYVQGGNHWQEASVFKFEKDWELI